MADKFVNFVSKVLKGNRYAQVAAENNDSEWREDIEFRQKSRYTIETVSCEV